MLQIVQALAARAVSNVGEWTHVGKTLYELGMFVNQQRAPRTQVGRGLDDHDVAQHV